MHGEHPFAKYISRARTALHLAVEEAQALNHNYIGTEHLLLGLIRDLDGVAATVLQSIGLDLDRVRREVLFLVDRGEGKSPDDIALSTRSHSVIELAVDEMFELSDHHFGTEHLLLGLLREGDGIGGRVLQTLGVSLESVRGEVAQMPNRKGSGIEAEPAAERARPPTIDDLDIDLKAQVDRGTLPQVVGRGREIEQIIQILSRREKSSLILLGPLGAGQMTVVQGLAQRMVLHLVPEELQGKRLVLFHLGQIGDGTVSRAEFEERVAAIVEEIRARQDCIVVLEDVRLLVGPGPVEGAVDTGRLLKAAVWGGGVQCICVATADEQRQLLVTDPMLHRRFQTVMVTERRESPAIVTADTWFAGFTSRLHWTLSFAQEEAGELHHNSIGTEHLLLGLIREGEGVAAEVLQSLGVQLPAARSAIVLLAGRDDLISRNYNGLAPRARKVVELAMDEAQRLNQLEVGTEHLLLGLVREGEGVGMRVLESLGVTAERVRDLTMQKLRSSENETVD